MCDVRQQIARQLFINGRAGATSEMNGLHVVAFNAFASYEVLISRPLLLFSLSKIWSSLLRIRYLNSSRNANWIESRSGWISLASWNIVCVELLTREYSCRSSSATRGMVRFMYSAVDTIRMLQSHSKPTGSHPMDRYNSHFVSFHTRAIIYENAYFVCCVAFHLTAAAAARIRCSVTEYSHQRKSLCHLCKIYSKWILQHEKYANEWLYHASRAQHSLRKFQFEVYAVSLHCPMMVPNIDRH